mgnify:CR=1 FL=1
MKHSILELFCDIDDFCQQFVPAWEHQRLADGERQRHRAGHLSLSEILTILVYFHQSSYRCFKHYYLYQRQTLLAAFPGLVSYSRFVYWTPTALIPLCVYLMGRRGKQTGISFVDATSLVVCHNRRIHNHKVFKSLAKRGKTSTGWFYGFKLHLVINDRGELLAFQVTPANTDDRKPVPKLVKGLTGKLFGDKGYISQKLFDTLMGQGLQLVTRIRKNMKNQLIPVEDKILLRKRALIETVNDQLKNISQIEHTRHRSVANFMVNLLCGLIAYTWQPKKPSLQWAKDEEMLCV